MGDLLPIYLNDHLAGATLGVELARRLRASNEDDPAFGPARLGERLGRLKPNGRTRSYSPLRRLEALHLKAAALAL